MPWEGVTVREQKQRFIEDFQLNYYTKTELAKRFNISRKTAHKWINRYLEIGPAGLEEQSRQPQSCPWQTESTVTADIIDLREKHPTWGPKKILNVLERRDPERSLPSIPTVARVLSRAGLVKARRRHRRAHPGCPQTKAAEPNDIWPADYKGQFRLKNGQYCFPLTVSDLMTRFILGVDAHPTISLEQSFAHFRYLFEEYGLPKRIRTDNGVPFASNALARLSQLSVWFIKLGIYPELIEPGKPQQNGAHERMHLTLKREATIPPASSLKGQQKKFDVFRQEFNEERPHEAIEMHRPAELYQRSSRQYPKKIETYDYPEHNLVRRVSRCGTIRVFGNQIFVSNILQGDYVGLEEVDDGVFDLFFCFYQIGRYDLRENKIRDILSRMPVTRKRVDLPSRV